MVLSTDWMGDGRAVKVDAVRGPLHCTAVHGAVAFLGSLPSLDVGVEEQTTG